MWQCASMSPGITVLPAPSIRTASSAGALPLPLPVGRTAAIRLAWMTTSMPRCGACPRPSITLQFSITIEPMWPTSLFAGFSVTPSHRHLAGATRGGIEELLQTRHERLGALVVGRVAGVAQPHHPQVGQRLHALPRGLDRDEGVPVAPHEAHLDLTRPGAQVVDD